MNQIELIKQNLDLQIQSQIGQLSKLFTISMQTCLQYAQTLEKKYPKNMSIIQILAACYALAKENYQKAEQLYQKLHQKDPQNWIFKNNIAWVWIKRRQRLAQAVAYLNQIKAYWHHPSILMNLLMGYQYGGLQDIKIYEDLTNKKQQYSLLYPNFQQPHMKGLIHQFLLSQEEKQSLKVKQFLKQIKKTKQILGGILIQNRLFVFKALNEQLQQIRDKIKLRKNQQANYGIMISKNAKTSIQAIEAFQQAILKNYNQDFAIILDKFVIQGIKRLNQDIFNRSIEEDADEQVIRDGILIPLKNSLEQIKTQMLDLNEKAIINQQIKRCEKPRPDRYERQHIDSDNSYDFVNKIQTIQKYQENVKIQEELRIQKEQVSRPLFHLIIFKNFQFDVVVSYYNNLRLDKDQFTLNQQFQNRLEQTQKSQRSQLKKYFIVLSLLLKFYNYYGTNNFSYLKNGISANLQFNRYIDLLTPILNQIGQNILKQKNIGWLCNEIHYSLKKYFGECKQQNNNQQLMRNLLRGISQIIEEDENAAYTLIRQIMLQKNKVLKQAFLSKQLTKINQQTKYHQYFNWKLNLHHYFHPQRRYTKQFNKTDDWIVSNSCLILITLAQNSKIKDCQNQLIQAFVACFYSSRSTDPYRNHILQEFYNLNHEIRLLQKLSNNIKSLIHKIIP